jgi:hypothetical protein
MQQNIRAAITFLTTEEGGRQSAPISGVRSQLRLGEVHTSCIIHKVDDEGNFELGREYPATIELLFGDQYGHLLGKTELVEFYEGSRLVARGRLILS